MNTHGRRWASSSPLSPPASTRCRSGSKGVYIPLSGAIHDAERLGYLPSDLLKRMQAVMARLTYVEGGDEGHLAATLKAMTPYEASEIASELVELAYMVGPEEP